MVSPPIRRSRRHPCDQQSLSFSRRSSRTRSETSTLVNIPAYHRPRNRLFCHREIPPPPRLTWVRAGWEWLLAHQRPGAGRSSGLALTFEFGLRQSPIVAPLRSRANASTLQLPSASQKRLCDCSIADRLEKDRVMHVTRRLEP
jgi:hypothetical protein